MGTIVVVILGVQLILLLFMGVANLYQRQRDVLSGRYSEHRSKRPERAKTKHLVDQESEEPRPSDLLPPIVQRCLTIIEAVGLTRLWRILSASQLASSSSFFRGALRRRRDLPRAGKGIDATLRPSSVRFDGSKRTAEVPASLPSGVRIYAIGDLHGRADLLQAMLEEVALDQDLRPVERSIILFLGDYVDRGPSSKEVLDILLECAKRNESVFLKGNHEAFLLRFLEEPAILAEWRLHGGLNTLISYGLDVSFSPDEHEYVRLSQELAHQTPANHLAFLNGLRLSFQCGDFLFVHAGVRPGGNIEDQAERDLLWIREEFLDYTGSFGAFVVHGHTPVRHPEIRSNRLNIDTGAFATGRLSCAVIEASTIKLLTTGVSDQVH